MGDESDGDDFERQWKEQSRRNPVDDNAWKRVPIFMESISEKDVLENADAACLSNILHEETSPEERANRLKNSGNNNLKMSFQTKNRNLISSAIDLYTQAIEVQSSDDALNSVIYSNRSQAEIYRENFMKAISDAEKAVALDPENLKAYYRSAYALFKLHKYKESLCILEALDHKTRDSEATQKLVLGLKGKVQEALVRLEENAQKKIHAYVRMRGAHEQACSLLRKLNIQQGPTECCLEEFSEAANAFPSEIKHSNGTSKFEFPVLFVYDSHNQTDFVKSVDWETTILQNLEMVFEELPPWDVERNYSRTSLLRAFFLPSRDGKYHEVSIHSTVKEMMGMTHYVFPGMCAVIHILPPHCELLSVWSA